LWFSADQLNPMKIAIIGAGYVGLTTAACLAELGHHVFCAESDTTKLSSLQAGQLPFFEPYLEDIFLRNRKAGNLVFGSTEEAVERGECIFICVGTPPAENGEADLSGIEHVARSIAKSAKGYRLIVEKSTVPVRTACQLKRHLSVHRNSLLQYDVASNPEFLSEGSAVQNFFHPDRIVVGVDRSCAAEQLRKVYEPILTGEFSCPIHRNCKADRQVPFVVTDTNSAELIKHAANSFLATKISFINMVSDLCEAAGGDISKVAEGIGLDPRVGPSFLRPGVGFGGYCFPKDLQAFVKIAEKFGCDFSLLKEVEKINNNRTHKFVEKIKKELWVVKGKRIGVWGLAFKPDTDDIRFAPALAIVKELVSEGALVQAYDPCAMPNARKALPSIRYCQDAYEAAEGVEAILLLTEWNEFRGLDFVRLATLVERPLIIDGRNCLDRDVLIATGFECVGVGGVRNTPASSLPDPSSGISAFEIVADENLPLSG
jgi:UDPglucose 6-dehydrogenase